MYALSQQKLLAKAKIYEKMQRGDMEDVEDYKGETRFLVDFDKKYYVESDAGGGTSGSCSSSNRPIDELAEKEEERRKHVAEDIYEADLDYRDELHEKWRKEQDDLLNGPVHYENIKFDEVRNLGTGYYAFSKNEEERQKQMEDLKKMRDETNKVHKKKEILQKKRKAALDARLLKVKQRKAEEDGRLDEFLKEIEKEQQKKKAESSAIMEDSNTELKNTNKDDNNGDSNIDLSSQTDALLKECRNQSSKPVREWDEGKHSIFTSQAFVKGGKQQQGDQLKGAASNLVSGYEKKLENLRKDRPDEFAPPNFY